MKRKLRSLFCGLLIGLGVMLSVSEAAYGVNAEELANVDTETDTENVEIGSEVATELVSEDPVIVSEAATEFLPEAEEEPVVDDWLSLGYNEILGEGGYYRFKPSRTGYYNLYGAYLMVNVLDSNGKYLSCSHYLDLPCCWLLEEGSTYEVEALGFSSSTLVVREVISEIAEGKHQLPHAGVYVFSPEEAGYYSVIGDDFDLFSYSYDVDEAEWFESRVNEPDYCYLTEQNYCIWVKEEPAVLEIAEAEPRYLQEGENSVEAGWYTFVPETSDFYTFSNNLYFEGDEYTYICYSEMPEYNFDYTWGYYLNEGETYYLYYSDPCDTVVSRIPYLKRSTEGLDYFVYGDKAIVIGYCGSDTLVWPEKIDGLTTIVGTTDFASLFKRNHELTITFPASMIGTTFAISYEWNEWTTDNVSVVSLKKVSGDEFAGQLTLETCGTANISLAVEDAEDSTEYYQYHITVLKGEEKEPGESGSGQISSGQGGSNHGESQVGGQEGNSGSGSTQHGNSGSAFSSDKDKTENTGISETGTSLSETGASENDTSKNDASSSSKSSSKMSTGVKTLIGGISVLALLQLVIGLYIHNKKKLK